VRQKLQQHINANFPFLEKKKLLIACSGGLDSTIMTRLLKELNFNISLAHCNFSLRAKESDGDEKFVINLADKLSIPIFNKTFDTKKYAEDQKISTQMAARDLRYDWFEELCEKHDFDFLLTAHHLDDDMETFFINLSRGTGLRGLTGIPVVNEKIIRPFLIFSRDEILRYAKSNNIVWREDSSNSKTDYLRNKLRLEVLPKFKDISEQTLQNFQISQRHLTESQSLINDYMVLVSNLVVSKSKEGYQINIIKLKELPNTDALLYELLSPYGFTAWGDVSDLLNAQSGKQVFSATHKLLKDRDVLLLSEIPSDERILKYQILAETIAINDPLNLKFEVVNIISETDKNTVYLDRAKLKFPLVLRKWKDGDYFFPFGMKGKKKVSKFFKDEKLSLLAKENCWLLCTDKDEIVWLVGMRMDERFKVDSNTKEILKITLKEL